MGSNSLNFHLPLHICSEILSYLPVKSLLRFRSVSKEWKLIIDNPDFASVHLSHYPNNCLEPHLIVFEKQNPTGCGKPSARSCSVGTYKAEYNSQTSEFDIPIPHFIAGCLSFQFPGIMCDVNGLLLVQKYELTEEYILMSEMFLWNPSIRKTFDIPLSPFPYNMLISFLGFDPSTNDYKVVSIPHSDQPPAFTPNIFSLKSCSWRRGRFSGGGGRTLYLYPFDRMNVSSGGSFVHWIVDDHYEDNHEFVTFNMTSETFLYTPLPKFDWPKYKHSVLVAGFLVGFWVECKDFAEIWVLKNDDCSWSRRYKLDVSNTPSMFEGGLPFFTKDGVLIWRFCDPETGSKGTCFYQTSTGTKSCVTDSGHWPSFYTGAYTESLVLLALAIGPRSTRGLTRRVWYC